MRQITLAMLLAVTLTVANAEAGFMGTFQDGTGFDVNVDNTASGMTALTITYLNRDGTAIRTMQNITVHPGQMARYPNLGTIPKGTTSRVFMDVQSSGGARVAVEVRQGGTGFLFEIRGDGRGVWDVVPSP